MTSGDVVLLAATFSSCLSLIQCCNTIYYYMQLDDNKIIIISYSLPSSLARRLTGQFPSYTHTLTHTVCCLTIFHVFLVLIFSEQWRASDNIGGHFRFGRKERVLTQHSGVHHYRIVTRLVLNNFYYLVDKMKRRANDLEINRYYYAMY